MGVNGYGRGVRRLSYPSGPWVDEQGRPARSPNEYHPGVATPEPPNPEPPNPDPTNFRILQAEQQGEFLLLKVHYPDCTNYEGNKVLLFKGVTLLDVVNQKVIDPHFNESGKGRHYPVARFAPTEQGWEMALKLMKE
jgi:hypothetical protein